MAPLRFRSATPTGYHGGSDNPDVFCAEEERRSTRPWVSATSRGAVPYMGTPRRPGSS